MKTPKKSKEVYQKYTLTIRQETCYRPKFKLVLNYVSHLSIKVVRLKNWVAQMSKSVQKYTVEEMVVQLSVVMCSVLDQFS